MTTKELVGEHYTHGALLEAIRDGIQKLGKTETNVTLDDLGPVEEFHIGGRIASAEFLDQLELAAEDVVLDVGCGLGGVARFAAAQYGSNISGLDLTEEYVRTGQVLNEWVGLQDRISLKQGNATAMTSADAIFDKAYMIHVGMNIADKELLAQELNRVLKPGGRLGIFDIMRTSDSEITFPVPWASDVNGSALATLEEYKQALEAAGFEVTGERNRHEFAISFFEKMQVNAVSASGPPPLGLHIIMGANAAVKYSNMVGSVTRGKIAPIEVFAMKPE